MKGTGEDILNDSGLVGRELSSPRSIRSKIELLRSKYDLGELAMLDKYVEVVAVDCIDHRLLCPFEVWMIRGTAVAEENRCGLTDGVEAPEEAGLDESAEGRRLLFRCVLRIGVFPFFEPNLVW